MSRLLWAPMALRPALEAAKLGARCLHYCPPRLTVIGGDVWVVGCAIMSDACKKKGPSASALFCLGTESDLPKAAARLERITVPNVEAVMASAVPLVHGNAWRWLPSVDVTTAQGLQVDAWRWFMVAGNPGLLGLRGDKPVALIALLSKHKAAFLSALTRTKAAGAS